MAKEDRNLAHAAPETIDELEAFKDWWDAHGNKVTIVLIAILALVVGFQQFTRWREKSAERAMSAFDQARTPEALEELIAAGKSAAVTPLARLRLAGVYFAEGKYDLSQSVYDAFLKSNGKHPLADVAKLGLAHCLEAQGKVAAAAAAFGAFADARPESFLAPAARLGQGRSLILAGSHDEGKRILDLFIAEKAGTAWAAQADEIVQAIGRIAVPEVSAPTDIASLFDSTAEVPEAAAAEAAATDEKPAEAAPAEAAPPAAENPAEAAPAAEKPAEAVPAPEAEKTAEAAPAAEKPAEAASAPEAEKPAEAAPAEEKPTEAAPAEAATQP
ncbi:MAG: tetratricopeptide repeat protein [Lentisphaerae bacterium]|nr:tetratricopeptide repeat protein [Lentisphaerota bacterium]